MSQSIDMISVLQENHWLSLVSFIFEVSFFVLRDFQGNCMDLCCPYPLVNVNQRRQSKKIPLQKRKVLLTVEMPLDESKLSLYTKHPKYNSFNGKSLLFSQNWFLKLFSKPKKKSKQNPYYFDKAEHSLETALNTSNIESIFVKSQHFS